MAIITVSRQLGSLGDEIAQNVANDLGYNMSTRQRLEKLLQFKVFHTLRSRSTMRVTGK